MAKAPRIRPLDLFSREEWARLSARSDVIALGLVVHCWAVIGAAMALAIWQPWLIPLAIPIIGARQLGLAILMHEAAHGGLSRRLWLNDAAGQWLCAAPIGAHLRAYRPYHLSHHKYVQQPEDPDLALSAPFPITRLSLRRKIIRDLTGQTFLKQRTNQFANALGLGLRPGKGTENRVQSAREAAVPFLAFNLILLAGLAALGHAWAYFALWLLPLATWNQMITRLRNIAEHAVVPSNTDPMRHARTTYASPLERLVIAPYWVNYHLEHHMFMHLPCYRLRAAHERLLEKGYGPRMEIQPSYWSILSAASNRRPVPA
ncbi:MAG: fatty acid desaturase family protein [Pseudomonadota bacterium]